MLYSAIQSGTVLYSAVRSTVQCFYGDVCSAAVCSVQRAVCTVHCAVCCVQCAVWAVCAAVGSVVLGIFSLINLLKVNHSTTESIYQI